ncbi:hypothetical protein FXW78_20660 [Rhodococcus opacus]|nr:hypothetical protein [Rhodococcus opacus]
MARPRRPRFTDEQRLKAFVLRARRITSHSLWREHRGLLEKARSGEMNVTVTHNNRTNETTYLLREEFPDEELLESLAARLRPLTLPSEELHYTKVLNSLAALVPNDQFPEHFEPIEQWRKMWDGVATRDESAQAYFIATDQGVASDQDLMYAWYYGDVVHADDKETESKGLGVRDRYKAAAGIVARIVECTDLTLHLFRSLVDEGVLILDPELFEREVVVTGTVFDTPVNAYASEVGSPLPTNDESLDPEVWKPMHDAVAPQLDLPSSCETWWKTQTRRASPTSTWKITRQRLAELLTD